MTFATLAEAQRECNNHAGEFPDWSAAVFEQVTDHRYFFMWAETPVALLKSQIRQNAYIVALLVRGDWERSDHLYRYLYAMHLSADSAEGLSPANKLLAEGVARLMRHNHFDEALRDSGGTYGGDVPEEAPYEYSLELEALFKLLSSEHLPDRVNALLVLSSWDLKLLPADMHKALEYLARNDSHTVVRQWAEFVLDPLNKPIPPRQGV